MEYKTNVSAMNVYFNGFDWERVLSSNDVNENWIALKRIILDAQDKFVPLQLNKSNHKTP